MTPPPLVSVIIAAYNAAPYIEATCRSAMRQTYAAIEIIVVDDGSTDETGRLVQALAAHDARITLVRQTNQGVAAARNRAIAAARGTFIAPLDADDLWDPEKIARQVEALERGGADAVMAYCWWAWIDVHGQVMDRSPRWKVEGRVLERLVEVNFTGSASVPLFRRNALDAVGGYDQSLRDRGCQGCEDWDVALRLAASGTVVVVPATLVAYRRRTDSMSSACDTMWRSRGAVIDGLVARTPGLTPSVVRRSAGQFALYLAGVAYWSGDTKGAVLWTLRAGPIRLLAAVAPHVLRLVMRPVATRLRQAPVVPPDGRLTELDLPEPLIPYDRIYERHWAGRVPR
jgi:glycosyltransferase involved in cell wall biosynthesis